MKHQPQFIFTYSQADLVSAGMEVLIDQLPAETLLKEVVWLKDNTYSLSTEIFALHDRKVYDSEEGAIHTKKNGRKVLEFYPEKLVSLFKEDGLKMPRFERFEINLIQDGEKTAYTLELEYLGESQSFFLQNITWNYAKNNIVDLTANPRPTDISVGILKVEKGLRPPAIAFQIEIESEPGFEVKYPKEGAGVTLLNKPSRGISLIREGLYRCEFAGLSNANFPLNINTNWLEDSRITKLTVWCEGVFEEPRVFEIRLNELTDRPRIETVRFIHGDMVMPRDGKYLVNYATESLTLGKLEVKVVDSKGEGYRIDGAISAGQKTLPVDIKIGSLKGGAELVRQGVSSDDNTNRKTTFFLSDKNGKEFNASRPFNKTYVHLIPLKLDHEKLVFETSLADCICDAVIELTGGVSPYTFKLPVEVKGSVEVNLGVWPDKKGLDQEEQDEIPINLSIGSPEENIYQLKLANTATKRSEGKNISVKLKSVVLNQADEESLKWNIEVRQMGEVIELDQDGDSMAFLPLKARDAIELDFFILPTSQLGTYVPKENLTLSWKIAYVIHDEGDEVNNLFEGEVRLIDDVTSFDRSFKGVFEVPRQYSFSLKPVIKYNYLSVDLGTSAIVAAYTNSDRGEQGFVFLDLQKRLWEIRNSEKLDYDAKLQPEGSTRFISSNILLSNKKEVKPDEISNSMIELAASEQKVYKNSNRWLPNIKMLFGGTGVSKLKKAFEEKFSVEAEYGPSDMVEWDDPEVIRHSMHALVHLVMEFFIKEDLLMKKYADNFTKVVFTVPNNFSKEYRNEITRIAERPRSEQHAGVEVSFVSESDAIAYSYLDHWRRLHAGRSRELMNKETILAYDIGAGTVDISLVTRQVNPMNREEMKLFVKGRVGLPKAGNYLDYLLGQVVWDLYGLGSESERIVIQDPFEDPSSLDARRFHKWIKNYLKPRLALVDSSTKSPTERYDVEDLDGVGIKNEHSQKEQEELVNFLFNTADDKVIDLVRIMNHEVFVEYINEITAKALEKLFYNAYGEGHYEQVDTILYSGRTSQMKCIKHNLLTALSLMPSQSVSEIAEVSSEGWKMANLEIPDEKLKGIVAFGGLSYLKKYSEQRRRKGRMSLDIDARKLVAGYGILFNNIGGLEEDWEYIELIHPQASEEFPIKHSLDLTLGEAGRMYLVQTFDRYKKDVMDGFKKNERSGEYIFEGDYTIALNDGKPYVFSTYALDTLQVTSVSIIMSQDYFILKLHRRDNKVVKQWRIDNYQKGYNMQSPAIAKSLWPFISD